MTNGFTPVAIEALRRLRRAASQGRSTDAVARRLARSSREPAVATCGVLAALGKPQTARRSAAPTAGGAR